MDSAWALEQFLKTMEQFFFMGRQDLRNTDQSPTEIKKLLNKPVAHVSGHWDDYTSHFNISVTGFGGRCPFTLPEYEEAYINGILAEATDRASSA